MVQQAGKMGKRSEIGKFIHSTWISMNIRAGIYRHLQTKHKCTSYKDITIEFSREDYKIFVYLILKRYLL